MILSCYTYKLNNKKETNMKINETNKQRIHDVLITDIQRMIFKQHNELKVRFNVTDDDYDNIQTLLYSDVTKCNTIDDVNTLLIEYKDLFEAYGDDDFRFTLDGTLNYVLTLLIKQTELLKCKC